MKKIIMGMIFVLMALLPISLAEEDGDLEIFGMEAEKLLNLGSGVLAAALCTITFIAYRRTSQQRLLYVSLAFALFAIKGFLTATELFIEELPWVDPITSFLDFGILLAFFAGLLKK